jgi:hypothetical protein
MTYDGNPPDRLLSSGKLVFFTIHRNDTKRVVLRVTLGTLFLGGVGSIATRTGETLCLLSICATIEGDSALYSPWH